jgi:hypothetical protein
MDEQQVAPERQITRIVYIAKCPQCSESKECGSNPPRERFCGECKVWVPYEEHHIVSEG